MKLPDHLTLDHLDRMTDSTGLIQHAIYSVPRRESGMTPYEVLLSESQERMLLVCTPDKLAGVMAVLDKWDLDGVVIGKVIEEPVVRVFDGDTLVAEVPARSLAEEAPVYERPFVLPQAPPPLTPAQVPCSVPVAQVLARLLRDPSIASKRSPSRPSSTRALSRSVCNRPRNQVPAFEWPYNRGQLGFVSQG